MRIWVGVYENYVLKIPQTSPIPFDRVDSFYYVDKLDTLFCGETTNHKVLLTSIDALAGNLSSKMKLNTRTATKMLIFAVGHQQEHTSICFFHDKFRKFKTSPFLSWQIREYSEVNKADKKICESLADLWTHSTNRTWCIYSTFLYSW